MKRVKHATGWAIYPYATTKGWGYMMVFRDKELAQKFADADPYYRELIELELRPISKKRKVK